jgi:hypothetical protein
LKIFINLFASYCFVEGTKGGSADLELSVATWTWVKVIRGVFAGMMLSFPLPSRSSRPLPGGRTFGMGVCPFFFIQLPQIPIYKLTDLESLSRADFWRSKVYKMHNYSGTWSLDKGTLFVLAFRVKSLRIV